MSSASIPFNPDLKDENRKGELIVTVTIFAVLLTVTLFMRIGTKLALKLRLGPDDYFAILSFILNWAADALDYVSVRGGLGRHMQFLTKDEKRTYRLGAQIAVLVATIAQWAARMSLCFFILVLIRGSPHKHLRRTAYALMTFTTLINIITVVLWFLQARPINRLWDPDVPGTNAPKNLLVDWMIAGTVFCVSTDLFYALSPLYFLRSLQMNRYKKATIMILTGCGLLTVAASIARTTYTRDFLNPDASWSYRNEFIASIVERHMAGMVANLPVIPPLWRQITLKTRAVVSRHSTGPRRESHTKNTNPSPTKQSDKSQTNRGVGMNKLTTTALTDPIHELEVSEQTTPDENDARQIYEAVIAEGSNLVLVQRDYPNEKGVEGSARAV